MDSLKYFVYKSSHFFIRLYWYIFKPKTYGVRAIILHDGKTLLVRNVNQSFWGLPGGGVDKGETPEDALMRELKEELALSNLKLDYKLGEYFSNIEGKQDTIDIFVIKTITSEFIKQYEIEDAQWFELTNLPKDLSPATSRRINEFKNNKRNLLDSW